MHYRQHQEFHLLFLSLTPVDYLQELNARFEKFTAWAISNFPADTSVLTPSDLRTVEKELHLAINEKLRDAGRSSEKKPEKDAQYEPVTPMPWP